MRLGSVILLCALLVGCGLGGRGYEPPPTITVEVLGPDEFLLAGQTLDREQLDERLEALGQIGRNTVTNTTRSRVRILADGGGANATARRIAQHCAGIGLPNVFFEDR